MKSSITVLCLLLLEGIINCQDFLNKPVHLLSIESSVISDNVVNMSGGMEKGFTSLALFDFAVYFQPFTGNILRNARVHAHILKTAGTGPSEKLTGDVQSLSNIEGKSSRLLYELSLQYHLDRLDIILGLHDLNSVFATSDFAGDFINSSFGIFPSISLNIPVSIYPVTSVGAIIDYHYSGFGLTTGLYNLNLDFPEEKEFDIRNHFYQKGFLGIAEFKYNTAMKSYLSGEYKLGLYYKKCSHDPELYNIPESCGGTYLIADQEIFRMADDKTAGIFFQLGLAPGHFNLVPRYYGFGISLRNNSEQSILVKTGLAIAMAELNGTGMSGVHESALELTTELSINEVLSIKPGIQYIINPAGIYPNSLAGTVRIIFDVIPG